MVTQQEIFETVANALLKQKKKSAVNKPMYRSPDGLKCAIGHLIDDEDYKSEMESKSVMYLRNIYKLNNSPLLTSKSVDSVFYERLQKIHDNAEVEDWKDELIEFGNDYGLDTNFLTKKK